ELDPERDRVQIGIRAPTGHTGVPRSRALVDKLVDRAIARDQVMRAYAPARIGERAHGVRGRIAAGGMNDDEAWPPLVEIRRWLPQRRWVAGPRQWRTCGEQRCGNPRGCCFAPG